MTMSGAGCATTVWHAPCSALLTLTPGNTVITSLASITTYNNLELLSLCNSVVFPATWCCHKAHITIFYPILPTCTTLVLWQPYHQFVGDVHIGNITPCLLFIVGPTYNSKMSEKSQKFWTRVSTICEHVWVLRSVFWVADIMIPLPTLMSIKIWILTFQNDWVWMKCSKARQMVVDSLQISRQINIHNNFLGQQSTIPRIVTATHLYLSSAQNTIIINIIVEF